MKNPKLKIEITEDKYVIFEALENNNITIGYDNKGFVSDVILSKEEKINIIRWLVDSL